MRRGTHQRPGAQLKRTLNYRAPRIAAAFLLFASLLLALHALFSGESGVLTTPALISILAGIALLAPLIRTSELTDQPAIANAKAPEREIGRASDDALQDGLHLTREAAGASEASLWRVDTARSVAVREASSREPDLELGPANLSLPGHPFAWAVLEQVHVRLERGRRVLPSGWAEEMLLIPLGGEGGRLLALAYRERAPEMAEVSAFQAARHIADLLRLLDAQDEAVETRERVQALMDAVTALPGELHLPRFAARFCEMVQRGSGADGVAMVIWHPDRSGGEVMHVTGSALTAGDPELWVPEGLSKAALAAKHLTPLYSDDLHAERDHTPLVLSAERWDLAPCSASAVPLVSGDRALGVLVAWHTEPRHFGASEREFLELLASVAALPLQNARQYAELDRRASTDALTRLPNRSAFEAHFASLTHHFNRYSRPFGLLILDIDHFKQFNDTYGHSAGDRVLRHVGEVLRATIREADFPARFGGEEFVVLLPETGAYDAFGAAERIRKAIEKQPLVWGGHSLEITVSLGVAACPDPCEAPTALMEAADQALYRSKDEGRNRVSAAG